VAWCWIGTRGSNGGTMMMLVASDFFKVGLQLWTCDLCSTNLGDILVLTSMASLMVLAIYIHVLSRFLEG